MTLRLGDRSEIGEKSLQLPFRLGEKVCFAFQTNRECQVALIDVGTSGKVVAVLPNAWCGEARVVPGQVHLFPGPEFADFTLGGQPGRERVFALAVVGAWPLRLVPRGSEPFRTLDPAEIDALADSLMGA
jgi:hypothetical protein